MIVAPIRSILISSPVSVDVEERIFPLMIPEGEPLPVLVLQEVNHIRDYSLQHLSRVQVSVMAESTASEYGYDIAHRICDIVLDTLQGYTGVQNSVKIEEISHIGDTEMMNDELSRFLIHSDFYVNWST